MLNDFALKVGNAGETSKSMQDFLAAVESIQLKNPIPSLHVSFQRHSPKTHEHALPEYCCPREKRSASVSLQPYLSTSCLRNTQHYHNECTQMNMVIVSIGCSFFAVVVRLARYSFSKISA